jgi:hypothetical protein
MTERCALEALLSVGGPVRVALRPCCLAALVGRRPEPAGEGSGVGHVGIPAATSGAELVCAAADAELQVTP